MLRTLRFASVLIACAMASRCGADRMPQPPLADDPIAREVAVWQSQLADASRTDAYWTDVKPAAAEALKVAREALAAGRRWAALERLSAARLGLAAAQYVDRQPAGTRRDIAGFEAEWTRMGQVLTTSRVAPATDAFAAVHPAAARALAEAAAYQVRVFYDASADYARATDADAGLFYIGSAQAQAQFVEFARVLSPGRGLSQPPIRGLGVELETLETDLLALYRPPVSIDRHPEFIAASSALKEARELDAAGLRYGALQRYLVAAERVALLGAAPAADADAIRGALRSFESRLADRRTDDTIARIFLERAATELDGPAPSLQAVGLAAVTAADLLPKYFAALEDAPAPPAAATAAPRVTVTLVRWPYT